MPMDLIRLTQLCRTCLTAEPLLAPRCLTNGRLHHHVTSTLCCDWRPCTASFPSQQYRIKNEKLSPRATGIEKIPNPVTNVDSISFLRDLQLKEDLLPFYDSLDLYKNPIVALIASYLSSKPLPPPLIIARTSRCFPCHINRSRSFVGGRRHYFAPYLGRRTTGRPGAEKAPTTASPSRHPLETHDDLGEFPSRSASYRAPPR
jgi:hypothetical protein